MNAVTAYTPYIHSGIFDTLGEASAAPVLISDPSTVNLSPHDKFSATSFTDEFAIEFIRSNGTEIKWIYYAPFTRGSMTRARTKSYTLLEFLAVVAVITIVAGIILGTFVGAKYEIVFPIGLTLFAIVGFIARYTQRRSK